MAKDHNNIYMVNTNHINCNWIQKLQFTVTWWTTLYSHNFPQCCYNSQNMHQWIEHIFLGKDFFVAMRRNGYSLQSLIDWRGSLLRVISCVQVPALSLLILETQFIIDELGTVPHWQIINCLNSTTILLVFLWILSYFAAQWNSKLWYSKVKRFSNKVSFLEGFL